MTSGAMAAGYSSSPMHDVRRHRVELLEMTQRLERALAIPIREAGWRTAVTDAVAALRASFAEHRQVTEGRSGLYAGLLESAPRLDRAVHGLVAEHEAISEAADALAQDASADPAWLRRRANDLLRALSQHRQRGADLVYEAYSIDIGGET